MDENNNNNAPEEKGKASEFDLTLLLILMGILGIGAFLYVAVVGF